MNAGICSFLGQGREHPDQYFWNSGVKFGLHPMVYRNSGGWNYVLAFGIQGLELAGIASFAMQGITFENLLALEESVQAAVW